MKKPHILIITCMYSRPVISKAFCAQIKRLQEHHANWLDITCVAGVSEDLSAQICAEHDIQFNWFDNLPLGQKWNLTLDFAIHNNPDYDYVCIMGDDDFMNNQLFLDYLPFMLTNVAHFGVQSMFVYSAEQRRARYFRYADDHKLIGAGRMISKKLIDAVRGEHPEPEVGLWDSDINRGLDTSLEKRCAAFAMLTPVVVDKVMITDVKTKTNLWPFEKFEEFGDEMPPEIALENLGEKEIEIIKTYYNKSLPLSSL